MHDTRKRMIFYTKRGEHKVNRVVGILHEMEHILHETNRIEHKVVFPFQQQIKDRHPG